MTENQIVRSNGPSDASPPATDPWRKEIHARLAGYRTRRGRRIEGAFSMRFPFPDHQPAELGEEVAPAEEVFEAAADAASGSVEVEAPDEASEAAALLPIAVSDTEEQETTVAGTVSEDEITAGLSVEAEPQPQPAPIARPRGRRKVIAFPRPVSELAETVHRLADPVLPKEPRILDVPEELEALPTTPFLDGLEFGPSPAAATRPQDQVALPLPAADIAHRMLAAALDCAIVAAAVVVFAAVGHKMLPQLVLTKPTFLAAAALPVLLWAAYQYVLLVYGGTTLGMRMAGIRLSTFRGQTPRFRERRYRVVGLYFSTASLAMGLLWALVDVDGLCWHDRISRTYLTDQPQPPVN